VAEKLSTKLTPKVIAKSLEAGAKTVMSGLLMDGPQAIIGFAIDLLVEGITQIIDIQNARPILETKLATAKQPIDLSRLMATEEGADLIESEWTTAMGGEAMPKAPLATYAALAKEAAKGPSVTPAAARIKADGMAASAVWTQLPGEALDVGASANALWVVGTNPVPGGYGLHRWDGKTFVPASGGALRIDLDPNGNPWVVNNAGQIFRWTGSAWVLLPGEKAQDIGVGANGTAWYVGGAKVAGGYSVFRWNAAANKWDAMPGGGVRIDVDPQGNAWMVNDANQIFRWTGSGWAGVPGKARDIGIGPDGSVFVVGDNGTVHKWDGKTWIMRDGILNEITVGPGGIPVGINASKQIWIGYP
jgi:hypothetical protein